MYIFLLSCLIIWEIPVVVAAAALAVLEVKCPISSYRHRINKLTWFIERNGAGLYEPLLQENEREAITELLHYLERMYKM